MKKIPISLISVMLMLSLTAGCFQISVEELYALPHLSEEYVNLQNQLDFILSQGLEYSPPKGGDNRQAVQLVDIDGDGLEEVVAFFSATSGAALKAYIYTPSERGGFSIADIIEGVGTGFESVRFIDMNNDGVLEIIVGWQMSEALRHMTLYTSSGLKHTAAAEADYTEMTAGDITGDGSIDILLARAGTAIARGEAEILFYTGALLGRTSAYLSLGASTLENLTVGKLSDGSPALFVDGVLSRGRLVTDILASRDGVFTNILLSDNNTLAAGTVRYPYPSQIFPSDISVPRDGVVEVPVSVRMPLYANTYIPYYSLNWYEFDISGQGVHVLSTLHDFQSGWYLVMPSEWNGIVTVRRDKNPYITGESVMVFSYVMNGEYGDFLRIYTLTGDTRADRADVKNRFRLMDDGTTIYAAEILNPGNGFPEPPAEDIVRSNFWKLPLEWNA